ncbi:MAG: ABC transporter permease [Gemmatimonadetes bacterium]|nr:ABC transporter permease [Gemmatimonadota bacterium]
MSRGRRAEGGHGRPEVSEVRAERQWWGERPLWQLTLCRFREFVRQPEAVFWVFIFPLLLAVVLGVAFRSRGAERLRIGIEARVGADSIARLVAAPADLAPVVLSAADAERELGTGRVALVVVPGDPIVYRYDSTRSESRVARLSTDDVLQRALGRRDVRAVADRRVTERGSRYIDFLIPGLLGLNLMGSGMWGVGFAVVQNRTRKLLKRLLASPMRRSHYLLSYMLVRLVLVWFEVAVIVGFGVWVFGVPLRGSLAELCAVALVGSFSFAGMGLLVASRAQTVEAVAGLMNLVMLPMWVLSGVFFSVSRFPDSMQPFIRALPLTALSDALRGVMLDGASLVALSGSVAIVGAWGVLSFGVALRIFRWL